MGGLTVFQFGVAALMSVECGVANEAYASVLTPPRVVHRMPPAKQLPVPALWVRPDGRAMIDGVEAKPKKLGGTRLARMNGMVAYDFDGKRCGLHFGDAPALRLTGSMTVSTWLFLRSYVNDGPGAQVLFRGDDRNGLDPYFLAIHSDGTVNFAVSNENGGIRHVTAEIPLMKWSHVVANFDADSGRMEMWLDGELVGLAKTSVRPFALLNNDWAPGVSLGNVQNDKGPHNQPLNGMIADLRLYRGVFRPADLAAGIGGWVEPPQH